MPSIIVPFYARNVKVIANVSAWIYTSVPKPPEVNPPLTLHDSAFYGERKTYNTCRMTLVAPQDAWHLSLHGWVEAPEGSEHDATSVHPWTPAFLGPHIPGDPPLFGCICRRQPAKSSYTVYVSILMSTSM